MASAGTGGGAGVDWARGAGAASGRDVASGRGAVDGAGSAGRGASAATDCNGCSACRCAAGSGAACASARTPRAMGASIGGGCRACSIGSGPIAANAAAALGAGAALVSAAAGTGSVTGDGESRSGRAGGAATKLSCDWPPVARLIACSVRPAGVGAGLAASIAKRRSNITGTAGAVRRQSLALPLAIGSVMLRAQAARAFLRDAGGRKQVQSGRNHQKPRRNAATMSRKLGSMAAHLVPMLAARKSPAYLSRVTRRIRNLTGTAPAVAAG